MEKKLKVLFHINEASRWEILLNNVKNLIKDIGEQEQEIEEIRVLANGEAVLVAVERATINEMFKIKHSMELPQKVNFFFCHNSLEHYGIDEAKLDFVQVVPAGVTYLSRSQNYEGFAYIKS